MFSRALSKVLVKLQNCKFLCANINNEYTLKNVTEKNVQVQFNMNNYILQVQNFQNNQTFTFVLTHSCRSRCSRENSKELTYL